MLLMYNATNMLPSFIFMDFMARFVPALELGALSGCLDLFAEFIGTAPSVVCGRWILVCQAS